MAAIDTKSVDDDTKSVDDDTKSVDDDTKSLDDDTKSVDDDTKSLDDDTKSLDDDTKSLDDDTKSVDDDTKSLDDDQNFPVTGVNILMHEFRGVGDDVQIGRSRAPTPEIHRQICLRRPENPFEKGFLDFPKR